MKVISSIADFRRLDGASASEVLRDFYDSTDHRLDPALCSNPTTRAELFFVDSTVHGLMMDPVVNWPALANTPVGRDKHSRRREWYLSQAEHASCRFEWARANAKARVKDACIGSSATEGLRTLPLAALAATLHLTPPPIPKSGPGSRASDELFRRALLLLATKGIPENLQGFHPPCIPLIFKTTPETAATWQQQITRIHEREGTPLFAVEPADFWSTADLTAVKTRHALFAFSSHNSLWHALMCDSLFEALLAPEHAILIGGDYPDERILGSWGGGSFSADVFAPFTPDHPSWQERIDPMVEAASLVLGHLRRGEPMRNADGQWLFELGLNLKYDTLLRRYGTICACSLQKMQSVERWFSPYKDRPPAGRATHPPPNPISTLTGPEVPRRSRRALGGHPRRRLVHVVSQVVDGGHAPSTLVRTLIERADRARWDVSVVSLESGVVRAADYPRSLYLTDGSLKRGARTAQAWKESSVGFHVCNSDGTTDDAIQEACMELTRLGADIAVWHGNDSTNLLSAARCDVPRRVFFEHSGLVFQSDFDLIIASLADAERAFARESLESGVPIVTLPYCSNARATWDENPPDFKVGPHIRILTTISNHLENRVAGTLVEAIATILRICPNAVYAPIGHIQDKDSFKARFTPWGVADRVMCVGASSAPSQLCRGMHLYLNEFPFGSGIAILDAMAAGLPVVTMYDPDGPMQAQNGGNYIGVERTVRSLDPVDYVTLACQLIQDTTMYREWSNHSLERFERFGPEPYVRKFETIIEQVVLAQPPAR